MSITVRVRNESTRKRLCRRDQLVRLAESVCDEEQVDGDSEISVLLCDDAAIAELNETYRKKSGPTDVLSFEQPDVDIPGAPRFLGDIVISLETVERAAAGSPSGMRDEVRLLFCHGLLHLLGYDHQTDAERDRMVEKQARHLGVPADAAWHWEART